MPGVRALLIEDDAKTARALAKGATGEAFEAMTATTGEEGFFLLSRETFDVVILDSMLPGRDGIEVLKDAACERFENASALAHGARCGGGSRAWFECRSG